MMVSLILGNDMIMICSSYTFARMSDFDPWQWWSHVLRDSFLRAANNRGHGFVDVDWDCLDWKILVCSAQYHERELLTADTEWPSAGPR